MDDAPESEIDRAELIRRADASYASPPAFVEFLDAASTDLGPWHRSLEDLARVRAETADEAHHGALRYLLRAAAVETGAIEGLYETSRGFTFTVAADTLAVEQLAVEKGEDFVRLFDAQLASFEMALDAATGSEPLSESWLRQLHEVTTAGQETYRVATAQGVQERPLPRGTYKSDPNHVLLRDGGTHSYAPVTETAHEVRRLIEQLRTDEFLAADAVHQAAYAHYAFVAVHPFADGNGRVARALASVFLLRVASVPLFIYADQTAGYFDALSSSDAGDHVPFTRFVRDRAIAVARTATSALERADVDRSDVTRLRIASQVEAASEAENIALDDATTQIVTRLLEHLNRSIAAADLPSLVQVTAEIGAGAVVSPSSGWRVRSGNRVDIVQVVAVADLRARPSATWAAHVQIATKGDASEAFRVIAPRRSPMMIGLADVRPQISHELDLRLSALADRTIGETVRELSEMVQSSTDH